MTAQTENETSKPTASASIGSSPTSTRSTTTTSRAEAEARPRVDHREVNIDRLEQARAVGARSTGVSGSTSCGAACRGLPRQPRGRSTGTRATEGEAEGEGIGRRRGSVCMLRPAISNGEDRQSAKRVERCPQRAELSQPDRARRCRRRAAPAQARRPTYRDLYTGEVRLPARGSPRQCRVPRTRRRRCTRMRRTA